MQRIYLAGGGGAKDSAPLDARFASGLDKSKPLVYIPVAMKPEKFKGCLDWFESVFAPLGITRVEMWTDLSKISRKPQDISCIYIGGGDTLALLKHVYESKFDAYLKDAICKGIPVYGGSAGAIILGKDIRSSPECRTLSAQQAAGIDTLFGNSVVCHYEGEDLRPLQKELSHTLIAIPERSGAYVEGRTLEVVGSEPVHIISGKEQLTIQPGQKYYL